MEYLEPKHFDVAKANGIDRKTAHARYYQYGWNIKKTITTPKNCDRVLTDEQRETVKRLVDEGVFTHSVVYHRMSKGMTFEEAISKPMNRYNRKYPKEWKEIAEKNGIDRNTFCSRIRDHGWSPERAMTEPVKRGGRR